MLWRGVNPLSEHFKLTKMNNLAMGQLAIRVSLTLLLTSERRREKRREKKKRASSKVLMKEKKKRGKTRRLRSSPRQTFQARLQEASFALGVSAEELSQMLPSGGLQELSGLEEAVRVVFNQRYFAKSSHRAGAYKLR